MRCVILYSSNESDGRNEMIVAAGRYPIYIRTQIVIADDLSAALDRAKPKRGEVVLNAIAAPDPVLFIKSPYHREYDQECI